MRKIFSFGIIFVFLLTVVISPAFAVTRPAVDRDRPANAGSKAAERRPNAQNTNIDRLKDRAIKEIDRRIASLERLLTRMSEFKRLAATQKSSLTAQVQAEIDKLEALKAKITAGTDIETLKTDIQSIVTAYRIYALFMPKIQILGAADRLQTTADQMSSHAARLQVKIEEQEANGQDVADAEELLVDINASISDAKTQAQNAISTVTPLTPEGFPDNKKELQSAREMIVEGIKDLKTAQQDARKIIVWLVQLNETTTPTVTTTP